MLTIHWVNGQAGGTPLSAENLNLMQQYIQSYIDSQIQATQENEGNRYVTGQEYATKDKLNGKTIYFRRYYFETMPDTSEFTKPAGFVVANITPFKICGVAKSNSNNWFPLPSGDYDGNSQASIHISIRERDNAITLRTINSNFVNGEAYIQVYYTKNSEEV